MGYIANKALIASLEVLNPQIKSIIFDKFIDFFTVNKHTFILCHGKDAVDMFKNMPLTLNVKTENQINEFIDYNQLSGNIHFIKGDLHQSATTYGRRFRYKSVGSFFGSSAWMHKNFGLTLPSVDFDILKDDTIFETKLILYPWFMEISINELLKGKPTVIKNKEFLSTKEYVEPFIDKMSAYTDKFIITVQTPDQLTLSQGLTDITYNRVLIQAVLPDKYCIDEHDEVIGFLYGIDTKLPVAKIYRGYLNRACTNLTVFNPEWIDIQEIIPESPLNYTAIKRLKEADNDLALRIKQLKDTHLDRSKRTDYLGKWVDKTIRESISYGFGYVKLPVTAPIDAYKQLFIDRESPYYVEETIDPTMYTVYNSFTNIIKDDSKDLLNKFEKTVIVDKILNLV